MHQAQLSRAFVVVLAMVWSANALPGTGVEGPSRTVTEPHRIESPQRAGASPLSIADLFYARESFDASLVPDGRDLVISTNLTGRHNLWRVPLSGGFPTQLTRSDERQFGTDRKSVV